MKIGDIVKWHHRPCSSDRDSMVGFTHGVCKLISTRLVSGNLIGDFERVDDKRLFTIWCVPSDWDIIDVKSPLMYWLED